MPSPRVFVSSTCYDLGMAREMVRSFLLRLGYEPIMSEYSDVLYDPRTHTHASCVQEVPNADMVILIIGSRFGGTIIPETLSEVSIEKLREESVRIEALEKPENLSITQLETLKAIEAGIPVFAFVEENVMHDHLVYEKNKESGAAIVFPSVDNQDSAVFIFEFISFLNRRNIGNSVTPFKKVEDIEDHLKKQWGALFQRLLFEQRGQRNETMKMDALSEQIEGLKAAVISTISNKDAKEVARGVIGYRKLIEFLAGLHLPDNRTAYQSNDDFDDLLKLAGISEIRAIDLNESRVPRTALIKEDQTFFELRMSRDYVQKLALDWQAFCDLPKPTRKTIFEAIVEIRGIEFRSPRYCEENFFNAYDESGQKIVTPRNIGVERSIIVPPRRRIFGSGDT